MSQQSQHTPSFFHVTGRSHIPQGKILLCLGPGVSSISPASNIVIRITEVFVLFFTESCIGLRPADVNFLFSIDVKYCLYVHDSAWPKFVFDVAIRIIINVGKNISDFIQYSEGYPH